MPTTAPDPITLFDTKANRRVIAHGSPLHRLQTVFEDRDRGVLVGDLRDVLDRLNAKDATVTKLRNLTIDKQGQAMHKGDRVVVEPADVNYLTTAALKAEV